MYGSKDNIQHIEHHSPTTACARSGVVQLLYRGSTEYNFVCLRAFSCQSRKGMSQHASQHASLARAFQQGVTSLDLARHKWARLSSIGRAALTTCVNCELQLAHVHSEHWAAGCGAARRGAELRALRERREAHSRLRPVLDGLDAATADMGAAVRTMRDRLEAACRVLGRAASETPLLHTESASQLLSRSEALAAGFESEWRLRRDVAAELLGGGAGDRGAFYRRAGWEATARIYLSAWMLQPFVDRHDEVELFLEGLAAEPPSPGRSPGRSPRS